MAKKESGLLMSLGKKILGFSASSSGCCAAPAATQTQPTGSPDAMASDAAPRPSDAAGSAPSCCSSAEPAGVGGKRSARDR